MSSNAVNVCVNFGSKFQKAGVINIVVAFNFPSTPQLVNYKSYTRDTRSVFRHIYLECTSYLIVELTIDLYVKSLGAILDESDWENQYYAT